MANVPHWMKRRDVTQQMRELGVPSDVTGADLIPVTSPSSVRIDCVGGATETCVFDLGPPGGTGYMASVSLTVQREPFAIAQFALTFPWKIRPLIWLSDPVDGNRPRNTYQFPGPNALEFPRRLVINHRADPCRNLRHGTCIEGLLLAWGLDSIPDCFQHGSDAVGRLSIFDQFDQEHSAEVNFWIDRSATLSAKSQVRPPRKSLFADRIFPPKTEKPKD
jgi:hypothetical protein